MVVSELKDGNHVYGMAFLVVDANKCVGAKNKYWTATLQDYSGSIEAKKWSVEEGDDEILAKGNVVSIDGDVLLYKDALQLKILSLRPLSQENVDWSKFVPHAPVSQEILEKKLNLYLDSLQDEDVKVLTKAMVEKFHDRYVRWPAASKNHHDCASGLLYHSVTMADAALMLCKVYPSLNRDIVIAGTILHDLGKTIELSGPNATSYTLEGKLLGHISIGQAELRETAKKLGYFAYQERKGSESKEETDAMWHRYEIAVTMEHIILSHHSQPDYGSPEMPLTREALAVAMIDDLDAKMMILDKAYHGVKPGDSTAKLFTMDNRYFYFPTYAVPGEPAPGLSLEEQKKELSRPAVQTSKPTELPPSQDTLF